VPPATAETSPPSAAFYFDLASPLAYLAAERILHVLPAAAGWQPILASQLGASATDGAADDRLQGAPAAGGQAGREWLAARARELGLQPLRWPEPFPFDSSLAMRVATYAKSIGRTVPFAQAAFRQAFAGGHSLEHPDYVLIAAAACEMHPAAVLRAAGLRSIAAQLAATTAAAAAAGVSEVPAIVLGRGADGRRPLLFAGERAIEQAAAHMLGPAREQPR